MKKITAALTVLLVFMAYISAQHDAHEHGIAELHIHVSEQDIEMELHLPGADFIGFEHSDLSEEEEHALEEKIEMIENSDDLVSFRLAWFRKAEMELVEIHETHDEHEGHDEHDDDEGHHDEDEEDHDDDEEHHDEHSEYIVEMHYSFENQKHLRSADFSGLFDRFTSLEEVDWILITDMGQEAGLISRSEPRIKF